MGDHGQLDLKAIHTQAEGWLDEWWGLWQRLEEHILGTVLSGPLNDPESCRVRPRFIGLLRDQFTAIEFVSDILMDRRRRADEGTLLSEELLELPIQDVLSRLASASWLRKRALSFAAMRDTGGVGGLPGNAKTIGSLDAGEEFALRESIAAQEATNDVALESLEITRGLLEGKKLLCLEVELDRPLAAIEETAALQTWPRLDPKSANHPWISSSLEKRVLGGLQELENSHADSRTRLQEEHERCVTELIEHPGMAANTREEVRRRQYKSIVRLLLEPLDAAQLRALLDLPSENAADKRNSNYRGARSRLFPALFAEYLQVEEDW